MPNSHFSDKEAEGQALSPPAVSSGPAAVEERSPPALTPALVASAPRGRSFSLGAIAPRSSELQGF